MRLFVPAKKIKNKDSRRKNQDCRVVLILDSNHLHLKKNVKKSRNSRVTCQSKND